VRLVGRSTSDLTIAFMTSNANKINRLVLNIVIIQPGFLSLYFYGMRFTFAPEVIFNPGYVRSSIFTVLASTTISGASIYSSILGLDVVTFDTTHEVGFSVSIAHSTSTSVQVNVTYHGNKDLTVHIIYLSVFIYNNADLATVSPVGKYFYGTYSSTNANNAALKWVNTTGGLRSYNTLVGLNSFYIKGDTFFNYKITVQNTVDISSHSANNWIRMGYNFIIF
jgi:hypothetical protein